VAGSAATGAEAEAAYVAALGLLAQETLHHPTTQHPQGGAMRTFAIDSDHNITVFASAEEAGQQTGAERFHSAEQLAVLAEHWPAGRLVEIWNSLAGVQAVKKFTDRKTGIARIWKAVQSLQPAGAASEAKGGNNAGPKKPRRHTSSKNTKAAQVVALLKQPSGASLKSLMNATGWQAHSLRGFLSGHLRKKLGLRVKSFQRNGERVYAIRG
jgi:hypothetical protein